MKNKIYYIFFLFLTLFFTGVIFLIKTFYFSYDLTEKPEEEYIEETLKSSDEKDKYLIKAKNILKDNNKKEEELEKLEKLKENKIKEYLLRKKYSNIEYFFLPEDFSKSQEKNKNEIKNILENKNIYGFLKEIKVIFFKERGDFRGRMRNRAINLYSPQNMKDYELIAVFIHEFSHYIDIYSLERNNGNDISNKFYNISWYSTKVIKSGLKQKDFVSGYSMTNKYEDFAESLTYYILHNKDFLEKTKKSKILREKYNFFSFYIFKNKLFKNTNFSENNNIKNYYRDITKIKFSLKNFLQYLEKSI